MESMVLYCLALRLSDLRGGGRKERIGEREPQQEKSVKQKYDLMGRKIDGYDVRKGLYIEMKGNDSAGKLKVVK